jgi:RNA polymerase sigma-54 factor
MKQTLQVKLGQQLTMTPQLQQAIRLLQLSSLELQTEIRATLESNPMLETDEESLETDPVTDEDYGPVTAQEPASQGNGEAPVEHGGDGLEADFSSAWSAAGHGVADGDDDRDFLETRSSGGDTLRDHLLEQLHLSALDATERAVGAAIIEAVQDNGYLGDDLDAILAGFAGDGIAVEPEAGEVVLHRIQRFDPPGIAARHPRECMLIQLELLAADTPGRALARRVINEHLDLLAAHDFTGLRRALRVQRDELAEAITVIQSLDPHPGAQIADTTAQYIAPDVFVHKDSGIWRVRLNPDVAPRLRINSTYANMVKRADRSADNTFMRDHLQEARWFIKSVQSRNETLLRVATAIVERQRAFLEYGDQAMKPLVLRDIAEALEMHESTISRVTTEKYMHTPRGVLEFKYFFSSHVSTIEGGECSATAIRAMLKKMIDDEDRRKPLSDHRIAGVLGERGINVARRTVAKYRESLAIPPSNERKQLT